MISVKKYSSKMKKTWDDFVVQSNNGTIFHKQTFLDYHITRKFLNHSLLFYKKDTLVGLLPAAIEIHNQNKTLFSHPGASFGGFVFSTKTAFQLIQEIVFYLEKYLTKHRINSLIIINTPPLYFQQYDESLK